MQPPPLIVILTNIGGTALWLHVLLGVAVGLALRRRPQVAATLLASPLIVSLLPWPYLLRLKLYLPWVPTPEIAEISRLLYFTIRLVRGFGFLFVASLIGIVSYVFVMATPISQ